MDTAGNTNTGLSEGSATSAAVANSVNSNARSSESSSSSQEIISPKDDKQKAHNSLRESLRSHLSGDEGKSTNKNSSVRESLKKNLGLDNATKTQQAAAAVEQKPEPIAAPADMSAEDKKAFEALSPEMQKYISRRAYETQTNYTKKTMELSEKEKTIENRQKQYQAFDEVLSPVREEYAKKGISEADIVRRSIAWDQYFAKNPIGAAKEYLESYGIDPAELIAGEGTSSESINVTAQQAQEYTQPEDIKKLVREQLEQERIIQEQKTTSARNANAVQAFIASVPLFQDPGTASQLEAAMEPIVQGLVASNPGRDPVEILKEAYNYVAKGHPVFSELIQKYEAKNQAERTKQDAIKAQAASRSVSGGPGSGSPKVKFDNIRDNLRARLHGTI